MLDSDGDGIYDREEYLLGTDKRNPHSDGDGLSDYQETKEGWMVTIQGGPPYQIYSDPRFADLDRDFLTDSTEIALGTDPYGPDTDEDGISDSIDPFPTTPPCMDPAYLKLAAWWDATSEAKDSYWGEPLLNNRVRWSPAGRDQRTRLEGHRSGRERPE